jgi:uncharacterized membrane protein
MPFNRFHGDLGPYHQAGTQPLLWVIFALLLVLLVLTVLDLAIGLRRRRGGWRGVPAAAPADESLTALRLRYARGEIERAQFQQMSRDLGLPDLPGEAATAVQPPQSP